MTFHQRQDPSIPSRPWCAQRQCHAMPRHAVHPRAQLTRSMGVYVQHRQLLVCRKGVKRKKEQKNNNNNRKEQGKFPFNQSHTRQPCGNGRAVAWRPPKFFSFREALIPPTPNPSFPQIPLPRPPPPISQFRKEMPSMLNEARQARPKTPVSKQQRRTQGNQNS